MKMRSVIWHIDFDAECAKSGLVIALKLSLSRTSSFVIIKKKGESNNYEIIMIGKKKKKEKEIFQKAT